MPCFHLNMLYPTGDGRRTAKPPKDGDTKPLPTACGRCIGCRARLATDAGIRGAHELEFHDHARFLTITYENEALPAGRNLSKADIRAFWLKLRRATPDKLKILYCGEYGGQTGRPHYHAIVYGLRVEDEIPVTSNAHGHELCRSDTLEALWAKGAIWIGDVTADSCAYVGGYLLKDMGGDYDADKPYFAMTSIGEEFRDVRPYVSYPHGGLGRQWIEKYLDSVFPDGQVIRGKISSVKPVGMLPGGIPLITPRGGSRPLKKYPAPRYYEKVCEQIDPEKYELFRRKREEYAQSPAYQRELTKERLRVRKEVFKARAAQAARGTPKAHKEVVWL